MVLRGKDPIGLDSLLLWWEGIPPHAGWKRKLFLHPHMLVLCWAKAKAVWWCLHPKWGGAERQKLCQGCLSSQTPLPSHWLVLMLLAVFPSLS